jgi:beta-N-acetylhexosaminidase
MPVRAFITGLSGPVITPDEAAFLRDAQPWGLIIFKRNVSDPAQLQALTGAFREAVGRDAPVLVDQEGGRVQRLGPPHWPVYPAGAVYGRIYEGDPTAGLEAAWLGARLIASDLRAVGIDTDCLPVADIPVEGADAVIGERAYGATPEKVTALAGAVAKGLLAGGVLPVLKHIPGHGRATADSHMKLPVVETDRATLERTDFAPFRALSDLPLGMTAHVVFSAIDPVAPATTSAIMVGEVIRRFIGFSGLLMGDDVSMGALSGTLPERARASLQAGCDMVLHCNGNLSEMKDVAAAVPVLEGPALERAQAALGRRTPPEPMNIADMRKRFAELTAAVAGGAVTA